jgi:hypothetical protein
VTAATEFRVRCFQLLSPCQRTLSPARGLSRDPSPSIGSSCWQLPTSRHSAGDPARWRSDLYYGFVLACGDNQEQRRFWASEVAAGAPWMPIAAIGAEPTISRGRAFVEDHSDLHTTVRRYSLSPQHFWAHKRCV